MLSPRIQTSIQLKHYRVYYLLGSYSLREHPNINDLDINLDHIEFIKLEKAVKKGLGHIEFYNGQIGWKSDLTQDYNLVNDSSENDFFF